MDLAGLGNFESPYAALTSEIFFFRNPLYATSAPDAKKPRMTLWIRSSNKVFDFKLIYMGRVWLNISLVNFAYHIINSAIIK